MATVTNDYEYATTVPIRDLIRRLDPGRCLTGSTDFDLMVYTNEMLIITAIRNNVLVDTMDVLDFLRHRK